MKKPIKKTKSRYLTFIITTFLILVGLMVALVVITKAQTISGNAAGSSLRYKLPKRIPTRTLE